MSQDGRESGHDGFPAENVLDRTSDTPVLKITPFKAYVQVALVFSCVCFGNVSFYMLTSLQTSLNGVLGSVSAAFSFLLWSICSLLTFNIVSLLGLKGTIVVTQWLLSVYVVASFYPSWYTLLPGNILNGAAVGPALSVSSTYANILAFSLSKAKGKDPRHYVGVLQGIVSMGGLFVGAILGNGVSTLVILLSEPPGERNETLLAVNFSSAIDNITSEVCQLESPTQSVSDRTYYILMAVAALSSLTGIFSSFGVITVPGRTFKCVSVSKMWLEVKASFLVVLKALVTLKYMLVIWMSFFAGLEMHFFLSIFNKYFVTGCLGIGLVGVVTALCAFSVALSSAILGKIMVYVSRITLSIFSLLLTLTLSFFILFWERVPSYPAVFLLAAGIGVSSGTIATLAASYLGHVGQKKAETVFSIFWAARAFGGAVMFFLSSFASVQAAVVLLLVVLLTAYVCYCIAEVFHKDDGLTNLVVESIPLNVPHSFVGYL